MRRKKSEFVCRKKGFVDNEVQEQSCFVVGKSGSVDADRGRSEASVVQASLFDLEQNRG